MAKCRLIDCSELSCRYPLFYCQIHSDTGILKPMQNVEIRKSKYIQSQGFQISCSLPILPDFLRLTMLRTIQFYYKFCLVAVEISNIVTNNILPSELHRISSEKFIPQKVFFLGCILSKILCIAFQIFVLFHRDTVYRKRIWHLIFRRSSSVFKFAQGIGRI